MPIYEYTCESCEQRFELLVTASRIPGCPHCGGSKLKKEFSSFATHSDSGKGKAPAPSPSHSHGPACGCCRGSSPNACGWN